MNLYKLDSAYPKTRYSFFKLPETINNTYLNPTNHHCTPRDHGNYSSLGCTIFLEIYGWINNLEQKQIIYGASLHWYCFVQYPWSNIRYLLVKTFRWLMQSRIHAYFAVYLYQNILLNSSLCASIPRGNTKQNGGVHVYLHLCWIIEYYQTQTDICLKICTCSYSQL